MGVRVVAAGCILCPRPGATVAGLCCAHVTVAQTLTTASIMEKGGIRGRGKPPFSMIDSLVVGGGGAEGDHGAVGDVEAEGGERAVGQLDAARVGLVLPAGVVQRPRPVL